jgi:hypothetical protein
MGKKIKAQIRQTNIQNLNELSEEQRFEFQKALEKELETKNKEIQNFICNIVHNRTESLYSDLIIDRNGKRKKKFFGV